MKLRSTALLLVPALLSGCFDLHGSWEARTEYSAVWADDGSAVLIARRDYEERTVNEGTTNASTETRDELFEISVSAPERYARKEIVASGLPGWATFYFMKSAGYILVDSLGDAEPQGDLSIQIETGEMREIDLAGLGFAAENRVALLPAPGGATIAAVEVDPDPDAGGERIRFAWFDPRDGAPRFEARGLPTAGRVYLSMQWMPGDLLDVHTADGWFEVDADGAARAIERDVDTCAPTTSSSINAAGQGVWVEEGDIVIGEPVNVGSTWACL